MRWPPARRWSACYDWMFLLGQSLIPAVNALLLGSLLYQSRLVPRVSSRAGIHRSAPARRFRRRHVVRRHRGRRPRSSGLLALPIALWEFSLGVYLIVKGFKPSPITAGMTATNNQL